MSIERYVRKQSGRAKLLLGDARVPFDVTVNREANNNGTPRIMGGAAVRDWLQRNYRELDMVDVEVLSPTEFWLREQS